MVLAKHPVDARRQRQTPFETAMRQFDAVRARRGLQRRPAPGAPDDQLVLA